MAKQRSYDTRGKQKKNPLHCGTITREQLRTMDRANRRQEEIDSGINPRSGSGVHGGGKYERKRRSARKDRADGRQAIKNRDWD
jgi:hypothetical protein